MNKKEKLAKQLRDLADYIEKESVQLKQSNIQIDNSIVQGVDQENYQYETNHPDGERWISIDINLYDKDNDQSDEAFDPMDEIRKKL